MRLLLFLTVCLTFSACVIVSKTKYDNKVAAQTVKNQIDTKLSNSNQFYPDTCNLSYLLNTLGSYVNNYDRYKLDEERINFIKNELVNLYRENSKNQIYITDGELKRKVGCYLNFITNKTYATVGFKKFYDDDFYRKFRCKK